VLGGVISRERAPKMTGTASAGSVDGVIWPRLEPRRAVAVNQPGFCSRVHDRQRPQRVGFGRSFGVKLWGIWAAEGGLPKLLGGSKRFKMLTKMSGADEIAEGDIRHIEGSGAHLSFRTAQVASGVWVSAA
jgi:hypothetical protein